MGMVNVIGSSPEASMSSEPDEPEPSRARSVYTALRIRSMDRCLQWSSATSRSQCG